MTMIKVKDGKIEQVGIPKNIGSKSYQELYDQGWKKVKGTPKPVDGNKYKYGAPYQYDANEDVVYGTWVKINDQSFTETISNFERNKRNVYLNESDHTVLPDSPVTDVNAWKAYRQALRDVPQQAGFPFDIEWPEEPTTE